MPIFEYKGLDKNGKNVKNVIDSDNLRTARLKLKKDGIFVVEIKDKKKAAASKSSSKSGGSKTVPIKDLALMTRQLAVLVKAQVPLVDSLAAVSEQVEHPALSEAVADCKNMVNEGTPFYKALGKYPNMFSSIYLSMVEAAEATGKLDVILMRLADFSQAQDELRTKVKGALTYPVIMIVVTLGILAFLFTYVIPQITAIFDAFPDMVLPWYTQVTINISAFMVNYWYLLLGFSIAIYLSFQAWKRSPAGVVQWDQISLKIPLFGELNRMVAVSRFTRTLATLLNGGVPMLEAMQIVRNVVDNSIIARAIDDARSNISEGESVAVPLKRSGQFPPLVIHMIAIGEKTGDMENMLIQVSDAYDFQVKSKVDGLTSALGPVALVIMGLAISVIIFSVLVPIFEVSSKLSG